MIIVHTLRFAADMYLLGYSCISRRRGKFCQGASVSISKSGRTLQACYRGIVTLTRERAVQNAAQQLSSRPGPGGRGRSCLGFREMLQMLTPCIGISQALVKLIILFYFRNIQNGTPAKPNGSMPKPSPSREITSPNPSVASRQTWCKYSW